jgi:glucokinase
MENKKKYAIGIDIGGTGMKAILYCLEKNKIIESDSLATPKDSFDHFLIMLKALIDPLVEKAKKEKALLKGIGIGIAGMIDHKTGYIIKSPNIPILDGMNFIEKLKEKYNFPVFLDNDTNCCLRAEVLRGSAYGRKNVYGIIIGTGIGGAWWFNDKIYNGARGGAGEPGRMVVDFSDPIDLEKAYQKLTQNNPAQMAEEAYRGDDLAEKSYEETGKFLGMAFANIVNIIDPEIIVIGGSVIKSSDLFISSAKKTMKEFIMNTESKKIKIKKSKLRDQAGSIGAALLVWKHGNIGT